MFRHCPAGTLRAAVVVLILAYIALAGETIHCQYFPTAHNEHGEHSPSEPATSPDHTVHCLVASHGGSVAVNTHSSGSLPTLTPTSRIAFDDLGTHVSRLIRLTQSRAPPAL